MVNVTINFGAEAVEPVRPPAPPAANADAHLIAQNARARGLRGGQHILEAARAVYLGTEWSGDRDRRGRAGRITKVEA